jgi:hypothetical protein
MPQAKERYSCTLFTSLTLPSGLLYSTTRSDSNTGVDFVLVLIELIRVGSISQNDILVCDNASVHFSAELQEATLFILASAGARIIFLPAYCPELNPCELVFNTTKQWLGEYGGILPLKQEVHLAFEQVSYWNIISFYHRCLHTVPFELVPSGKIRNFLL